MRRKAHYVIEPDYLWDSIVRLAKTQRDKGVNRCTECTLRAINRLMCVFHAKLTTDSTANWTVIPRQRGQ